MFGESVMRSVWGLVGLFFLTGAFLGIGGAQVEAKSRHAFLLGVGAYKGANGLDKLLAPPNDAEEMRVGLEAPTIGFTVDLVKDEETPDKAAFRARFDSFLNEIQEGDEVLFYFSGHGLHLAGKSKSERKGNYFLLPDAMSQPAFLLYLQKQKPLEARDADTIDKKAEAYEAWIAEIAPSEAEIEAAIAARKASIIVFVVDANRTLVSGYQDAAILGGLAAPKSTDEGVFKLYSASRGQAAVERPEEDLYRRKKDPDSKSAKKDASKPSKSAARRQGRKITSLYTREFLRDLPTPRLDISLLQAKVRYSVREEARRFNKLQVPAYSHDGFPTPFEFWQGDDSADILPRCQNAKNELDNLRYGVIYGVASRQEVELKRIDLAPCGLDKTIESFMHLQQQGAGETGPPSAASGDGGSALQLCDELAASRFDKSRPEEIAGTEVQSVALRGLASSDERTKSEKAIGEAIVACEAAVKERPRVARYKYNLARANYALSALSVGLTRASALAQTSKLAREATDLGHAAAYHLLGALNLNGELVGEDGKVQPPDRVEGWRLMQRGADVSHVLALFEMGLAYKNGDLEVETDDLRDVKSNAKAYEYLSKSAEPGFVPAMIEAALALKAGRGVPRDTNRAIQMLEAAAARGSPEAMFRLGEIYDVGGYVEEDHKVAADPHEATLWYARAAEFGDTRAQKKLAENLTKGYGLPAQQPETAARYWRLASDGGSVDAQMQLANLLRDGKAPFRPKIEGKQDGGAEEIRDLYLSAFARGNPIAGLELARLYRKGFPDGGSDAIPKDKERAVLLLWETMNRVRLTPDDSENANPRFEFEAARELMGIYDGGDATRSDGTELITADQIDQLRADYGDPAKAFWLRASSLGKVECSLGPNAYRNVDDLWVLIWDSKGLEPSTERQFNWFEEYTGCKNRLSNDKGKGRELGVPKKIRDEINRVYDESAKEREKNPDTYKKFTDRIAELISKRDKGAKR
ncbi:MAG: caspase family protein [Hyphomicrobium sp.]